MGKNTLRAMTLAILFVSLAVAVAAQSVPAVISDAVAHSARQADRVDDANRKPGEVLG